MVADIIKKEFDLSTLLSDISRPLKAFLIDLYRATASYETVADKTNYEIMEEITNCFPGDVTVLDVILDIEARCKDTPAMAECMREEAFFKNRVDLIYKKFSITEPYAFKNIPVVEKTSEEVTLAI